MSGGWGCPHDVDGRCEIRGAECEPGDPGCVLEERMRIKVLNRKLQDGDNGDG